MIVIAYYTKGTSYEKEAALFARSLAAVDMTHQIMPIEDQGSWDANTRQKPLFIRERREVLRGPLLYCDVDAFFHENVERYFRALEKNRVDFAAHWFAGPGKGHHFGRDNCGCLKGQGCDRPHRLLSGTLYFGDTPGARKLLDVWVGLNEACAEAGWLSGGGQKNLWAILASRARDLHTVELPGSLCYVFDKAQGYPAGEPIWIEHTIASRDNRKKGQPKNPARRDRMRELSQGLK